MNPQWLQQQQMQRMREQQQQLREMQERQQRLREQQQQQQQRQQKILEQQKKAWWLEQQQKQKQRELQRGGQGGRYPATQPDFRPKPAAATYPTAITQPIASPYPGYLFAKVQRIIAEQLGLQREEVQPKTNIALEAGADSLDVVELIMALEEEFDVEIPDGVVQYLRTPHDIACYINRKL
jgi:acyl carrier protein